MMLILRLTLIIAMILFILTLTFLMLIGKTRYTISIHGVELLSESELI